MPNKLACPGFRWRGLVGAVVAVSFGSAVVLTSPPLEKGSWPDLVCTCLAWILFVLGASFRFWSTLYIGGRKLGGRKDNVMVSEGPYSLCRNPLYVGTFLLGLSGVCFLQSGLLLVGLAMVTGFYVLFTVPAEEAYLRETVGEPYLAYCRRVPRYWPKFSAFETPATVEVSVRSLLTEARRAARWAWLPVLFEVVTHLRMAPWWPRF